MQQPEHVAVFWDFENLPPRSGVPGCETVQAIRSLAHDFGIITTFKAYLEVSPTLRLWSELQESGVALVDCPHRGRAEAASKMLLVDLITFAIDHPTPATIFLISEDRDFAYAISTLRHRKFKVVVLCPPDAHSSLVAQADAHFDWNAKVLRDGDQLSLAPSPAPERARHPSTSINGVTSGSDRKGKDRANNDIDLRTSHQSYSYSDRHEHTLTNPWQTPSRTTSRPYSPAESFQSTKSTPQTLSPSTKHKPVEQTFITDGDIVFESSSQPDLQEGFPFSKKESLKDSRHAQSTSASETTTVETSPQASTFPPAQSFGASNLQKPSTPPIVIPAATPAPSAAAVPAPSETVSAMPPVNTKADHKPILPPQATPAQPPHSKSRPTAVRPAPSHFLPLITALQRRVREHKQKQVTRSDLGGDLAKVKGLYAQAKVSKFASYMLLAEEAGIVTLGGSGSDAWVSLRQEWTCSSIFPS